MFSCIFYDKINKKGLNIDEGLLKKIAGKNPLQTPMIKTWKRACQISPEMVGFIFGVYNGKVHIEVLVTEDMVGSQIGRIFSNKEIYKTRWKNAERT